MQWHADVLIPFITLRCNFDCTYCITRFSPDYNFNYTELPGKSWIDFINSIDSVKDVIFNGGEPTLHPDFPLIINSLKPLRLIAIGTNYSNSATSALLKIIPRPDLIIDGSFHPRSISFNDIVSNLHRLISTGFRVRVHLLDYPGFVTRPAYWLHDFKLLGIDAFVQKYEGFFQDQFYYDKKKLPYCGLTSTSTCRCSRSIYTPIAPNGDIFFCHYFMYSNIDAGRLGNINSLPVYFPVYLTCDYLGHCNPCDWPRSVDTVVE